MDKPAILFVCLGNICRSPLAEAAFRKEAEAAGLDAEADSAGTGELTETSFKSVMFELCQTWTPGSNPAKYAAFLRDLLPLPRRRLEERPFFLQHRSLIPDDGHQIELDF